MLAIGVMIRLIVVGNFCVRAKRERILFLTVLPVANVRSRDVFPAELEARTALVLSNIMNLSDWLTNKIKSADKLF